MTEWLGWVSHGHEIYRHDLEVMVSNPVQFELGIHNISI